MNEEIKVVFIQERFRFENASGDVVIADVSSKEFGEFSIKGEADDGELIPNQEYLLYGRWSSYKNKRTGITCKQFWFQSFVASEPAGRSGIISYMVQAGQGNRIGNATASKIYDRFGEDSVRIMREEPEKIHKLTRVTMDFCKRAAAWLRERKKLEQVTIRLNSLLEGRGFPKTTVKKAIQAWGNRAAKVISRDPYQLMHFPGCGFVGCDNFYSHLGLPHARLRRQAYIVWYTISSNSDGHTWFDVNQAIQGLQNYMGTLARPKAALKLAKKICELNDRHHGAIVVARESDGAIVSKGGKVLIGEGKKANNEIKLADLIANANQENHQWPSLDKVENLSSHQHNELEKALQGPIAILGGSPGTGKTWAGANLIKAMGRKIGPENIAVAAPTGKAAVRISEVMFSHGVNVPAKTWHSLLGVGEVDSVTGDWGFRHNERNPFDFKLIIGDESSMLDTDLMCSVIKARARGTQILFLGDVNQLPPVGHGAPLRDFIAAGLPYGELKEIQRNSGGIVEACAAMRDEEPWGEGDNLTIDNRVNQAESIVDQIHNAASAGYDPIWDCQLVVAVNDRSPLSRKNMNKILQGEFNPDVHDTKGVFRPNDKIVCLKNGFFPLHDSDPDSDAETDDDGRVYVANGELAKVIEVEEKCFVAQLASPHRVIKVPRGKSDEKSTGCNWDLGYALSVHKSQGSEWPIVLVALDEYPGARRICDRSWIYTAISRARDRCFLMGKKSTADSMCRRQNILSRKTFLRERILLNSAKRELVEL